MNNLLTRTFSGIIFLIVLIGSIVAHPISFGVVMLVIVTLGLLEFYKLLLPTDFAIRKQISVFSGVILFLICYLSGFGLVTSKALYLMAVPFAVIFIAELYSKSTQPFLAISLGIAGIVYFALPFSLMNFLVFDNSGNYDYRLLLTFFIMLWVNDVGAYCFGTVFGRHGKHKLFERISPKKSWEGFVGGMLMSLLAGYLLWLVWGDRYNMGMIHWLVIGLLVAVAGTLGDLVESMLKRSVGVKDSGSIMPGHGGILDRFDGVLLSFPIVLCYIQYVNY